MSAQVQIRIRADASRAVESLAIAQESLVRACRRTGRAFAEVAAIAERWDRGATPDDRLYARRYLRASERSRRNQPPRATSGRQEGRR